MPDTYPLSASGDWWNNLSPEQKAALDAFREQLRSGHAHNDSLDGYYSAKERRDNKWEDAPGIPHVPHPSAFQPDPLVMGPPDFAKMVHRLIDLDPRTKEKTSSVSRGPTAASMHRMMDSGFPAGTDTGTTLGGVTDMKTGTVGIQRQTPDMEFLSTAHELEHVAGHEHGKYGAGYSNELLGNFTPTMPEAAAYFKYAPESRGYPGDIKLKPEPRDIELKPDVVNAIIRALAAKGITATVEK